MTEVRYHPGRTGPTTLPVLDFDPDTCPCGATYHAPTGVPDRSIFDAWATHHLNHMGAQR